MKSFAIPPPRKSHFLPKRVTMICLIFSDLHSNLEALEAFQEKITAINHDVKVCLGDTIGYGADPNACAEWVRENSDMVLAGNHDYAAVGKTDITYFNPYAMQACLWTRNQLTAANHEYFCSLPVEQEKYGIRWAHSSPFEPDRWHYVTSTQDAGQFEHFSEPVCFLGHTHLPHILELAPEGTVKEYSVSHMTLKPGCRYIVNVGSLGQPRDRDPNPAFVVYDTSLGTVEYYRFSYNIPLAQEKIRQQGLPSFLADRLQSGI